MVLKGAILKKTALPLAGLALFVSAAVSGPANAQFKDEYKKERRDNRDLVASSAWSGVGGSMLWLVLRGEDQSDPVALSDTSSLKTTQSCTTIWHGQVIPCNGFSP